MKSHRNVTYNKKNTAMGEEMRHVQMSRWGKRTGEGSEQQ